MQRITTINSIETSSLCDNACEYCPCKDQGKYRKTGLMKVAVFERAIDVALALAEQRTQRELNLFGVGEPTLNQQLVNFVSYARRMMPFGQRLHLNTNGNDMTGELAKALKDAGIDQIDITGHNHRSTANAIRIFRRIRVPFNVSYDFALYPNNWAGQVDWFSPEYNAGVCPWLQKGQVMVMSDGSITTCCIDAFGTNIIGNIFDDVSQIELKPFHLCKSCHHSIPESMK